jgi:hypothetical protein
VNDMAFIPHEVIPSSRVQPSARQGYKLCVPTQTPRCSLRAGWFVLLLMDLLFGPHKTGSFRRSRSYFLWPTGPMLTMMGKSCCDSHHIASTRLGRLELQSSSQEIHILSSNVRDLDRTNMPAVPCRCSCVRRSVFDTRFRRTFRVPSAWAPAAAASSGAGCG